jgi:hypothetical protein
MHACICMHARLATPMNGSPMRARRTHVLTCCVHARARARLYDWATTNPRRHMRARSVGVDCGWLGAQAFYSATAFNANIGAWNTASVSSMQSVCAALSGPGGAPPRAGRARRVVDATRRRRRCPLACVCADVRARARADVHVCR